MDFYSKFIEQLNILKKNNYIVKELARTELGRPIFCVEKIKSSKYPNVLLLGGIHAREWATSFLVLKILKLYKEKVNVFSIPLINVDGMMLVVDGLSSVGDKYREKLFAINGSCDFSMWKANANCVDLNVNFPYKWGKGNRNRRFLSSESYIGPFAFSETESQTIKEYVNKIQPDFVVNYHALGEEVYYGCDNLEDNYEKYRILEHYLNYRVKTSKGSYGGVKEWFISTYHNPSITIEIGSELMEYHDIINHIDYFYSQNKNILKAVLKILDG